MSRDGDRNGSCWRMDGYQQLVGPVCQWDVPATFGGVAVAQHFWCRFDGKGPNGRRHQWMSISMPIWSPANRRRRPRRRVARLIVLCLVNFHLHIGTFLSGLENWRGNKKKNRRIIAEFEPACST